jgi:hypothetical protein
VAKRSALLPPLTARIGDHFCFVAHGLAQLILLDSFSGKIFHVFALDFEKIPTLSDTLFESSLALGVKHNYRLHLHAS